MFTIISQLGLLEKLSVLYNKPAEFWELCAESQLYFYWINCFWLQMALWEKSLALSLD